MQITIDRYRQRLALAIEQGVARQNEWRQQRQNNCRRPLQSVFTRDCIARGRDIEDGGAIYNWAECSFIGLANLADSLHVIDQQRCIKCGICLDVCKDDAVLVS